MPNDSRERASLLSRQAIGWLAVFGSAFCFYLATLIIRWSEPHVQIETSFFAFARFLMGFTVVCATMLITRSPLKPRNYHYLLGRTISNTIAV